MNMVSGKTDTIFISVHQADSVLIKLRTPKDTANVRISQLFCPMVLPMDPLVGNSLIDLKILANIILL